MHYEHLISIQNALLFAILLAPVIDRMFHFPWFILGPTLKLKRPLVAKMYANTIDSFYANSGTD